jgi:predicted enzyme related to lactoylglutathione lyase
VDGGVCFYRDMLGLKLIEDFRYEGTPVYARVRAPGGNGTIALHQAGPGAFVSSDGVRLYFEVHDLDDFCRKLQQKGFHLTQLPRMMPWGWRHAYVVRLISLRVSLSMTNSGIRIGHCSAGCPERSADANPICSELVHTSQAPPPRVWQRRKLGMLLQAERPGGWPGGIQIALTCQIYMIPGMPQNEESRVNSHFISRGRLRRFQINC